MWNAEVEIFLIQDFDAEVVTFSQASCAAPVLIRRYGMSINKHRGTRGP